MVAGAYESPLSLCAQAAKGGTVKAASGFNAAEDAQTLRKAMKGLGKCPPEGKHPRHVWCITQSHRGCCVHRQLCGNLTLRKHKGNKLAFQDKLIYFANWGTFQRERKQVQIWRPGHTTVSGHPNCDTYSWVRHRPIMEIFKL